MNTTRISGNPFDLTKASDFSDEQIQQFWVDLAGPGGLEDLFKPRLMMPMLLLGGKGSGKTHLMRYFSSAVQKLRFNGSLLSAAQQEKHIGIYVRADGLNVGRFDGKGQSDDAWAAVFSYYFELWLATHLLKHVQDCLTERADTIDQRKLVAGARSLFTSDLPSSIETIAALIDYLAELRRHVDHIVANCAIHQSLRDIDICISPGALVYKLPVLLNSCTDIFKDVLFVFMIDEIENFTVTQQKFLNSLIRYREGPVSIKIGARLYGLHTKKTLGAGEEIKQNSEYEKVELDAWLREHVKGYKGLAEALILKRLQQFHFAPAGGDASNWLRNQFEELDSKNNYRVPTLALVKKYDEKGELRPYFKKLKEIICSLEDRGAEAPIQTIADNIIQLLQLPNDPLLEKVNLYLLYKEWRNTSNLVASATAIAEQARNFLENGKEAAPKYFDSLDHFKSDLLAQIYQDCNKQHVVYAGLDTLIHLSQGVPRNLLGILKQIFRRSHFAGERPFSEAGKISISSQGEGIRDAAAWFWDDAQPDRHGSEVRAAIESLAKLFRGVRYSLKPAECDLATFSVNPKVGSEMARDVLAHAENWSYLVRVRDGGVSRNDSNSIDDKFQLSPMLVARWEVSEHRRGAIELQENLFNALFDPVCRPQLNTLLAERLKGMEEPYIKGSIGASSFQNKLF
ncbi:ORC-CDC6 family AAA ATPase [Sideroxydans sp.]